MHYSTVDVDVDHTIGVATVTVSAPENNAPEELDALAAEGDQYWGIRTARELDDAILHLRFNEPEIGIIQFRVTGNPEIAVAHDAFLYDNREHWLVREILLNWARVVRRIDLTSRSLVALIEPAAHSQEPSQKLPLPVTVSSWPMAHSKTCPDRKRQ